MIRKSEIRNPKSETNSKRWKYQKGRSRSLAAWAPTVSLMLSESKMAKGDKHYDLEERTYEFARDTRALVKKLPRTIANIEDAKQLVRSSGSVGSNYIEANEALSKKDFAMRIKICRKEAKETRLWLRLLYTGETSDVEKQRATLIEEAIELTSIFGAIFRKSESNGA